MFRTPLYMAILSLVCGSASASLAAEKDQPAAKKPPPSPPVVHTVEARIGFAHAAGADAQVQQRLGRFTIPKGFWATHLTCTFFAPKSGYSSPALRASNIFSVTEHRNIEELDANPNFALPPGDYTFVVDGEPGASGALCYLLSPIASCTNQGTRATNGSPVLRGRSSHGSAFNTGSNNSPDSTAMSSTKSTSSTKSQMPREQLPRNGRLTLILWPPDRPDCKFHWTCDIHDNAVLGHGELPNPPVDRGENYHAEYFFKGNVEGTRITGTFSEKVMSEVHLDGGGHAERTRERQGVLLDLTFHPDHTVIGSETSPHITDGAPSDEDRNPTWKGTWCSGAEPLGKP
jgi:hypothetical protein